jgi:hypothetical protein
MWNDSAWIVFAYTCLDSCTIQSISSVIQHNFVELSNLCLNLSAHVSGQRSLYPSPGFPHCPFRFKTANSKKKIR